MASSRPPKNLQDILRQRQQSDFVGREDYLASFYENIKLSPNHPNRQFLVNVWGQGGVGKSTLLRQFTKIAQETQAVIAHTDENEVNILDMLGHLAQQFEKQGLKFHTFSERYRLFRQKKQELEADPDAPIGLSALVGKAAVKASVKLGKRVPVGGVVLDFFDEDSLYAQAEEWASYVAKKLRNQDEVQLLQEPVNTLTALFLQDLGKISTKVPILIFFDTYEETGQFLDDWLRNVILGKCGAVHINIIIIIAGRSRLPDNQWAEFDSLIAPFPLEEFTEEEAKQYLHRRGVTDSKIVDIILHLSGRLPLLVSTLAASSPSSPDQVGEPSGMAIERFLKWVKDPKKRQIALDAALPRQFNRDIVRQLATSEDADSLFEWLKTMPFVNKQRDGWSYHPVVRAHMLRYQRLDSPQLWKENHEKLRDYFEQSKSSLALEDVRCEYDREWQNYSVEELYHLLCMDQRNIVHEVNAFLSSFNFSSREYCKIKVINLFQKIKIIGEAGEDANNLELQDWGKKLSLAAEDFAEERFNSTIDVLSQIISNSLLEPQWIPRSLAWKGNFLIHEKRYKEALDVLNSAIELKSNDYWIYRTRGTLFYCIEEYQSSLLDYTYSIQLKPEEAMTFGLRGLLFLTVGHPQSAIPDFTQAINLDIERIEILYYRGMAYQQTGCDDEALTDFTEAINLGFENEDIFYRRGRIFQKIEEYEKALSDFARSYVLNPDNSWNLTKQGEIRLLLGQFDLAITDFNYSTALRELDWTFYGRGIARLSLNQLRLAKADFKKAIELAIRKYKNQTDNAKNIFNLALYYLADDQVELSKRAYQMGLKQCTKEPIVRAAAQDLKEFLKIFPGHPQGIVFYNRLCNSLEHQH